MAVIVFPNKDLSKKKVPRTVTSVIRGYRGDDFVQKMIRAQAFKYVPEEITCVRGVQGGRPLFRRGQET